MFRDLIRKRKGFTLIGLVIALAISAFVIISSLGVFVNAIFLNEISRNRVTAISDAQFVLEEIKRLAYNNINAFVPTQPANLPGEVITVNRADIDTNIKGVTVTVVWNEKQRPRTYQLYTRIAR